MHASRLATPFILASVAAPAFSQTLTNGNFEASTSALTGWTAGSANFAGLKPLSSYYKMPTDYCVFDGRIVMGRADASQFNNPLALKDQSNLWFGTLDDIKNWGAPSGHGAVWMNEAVTAGQLSDPFLIEGIPQRTLHLRNL